MNIEHFKKLLLDKKRDLESVLTRSETEARNSRVAEVGDEIDLVTSSEGKSDQFQISSIEYGTFEMVNDALARIESGEYGKCTLCGEEIEPARLEAVPWTPYCIKDQERMEKREDAEYPTL